MTWPLGRRILWLLAAATLIPIAVLSSLGSRILAQDRDVERQRRREALDVAAGRLAIDIERRLQDIEERLAEGRGIAFLADGLLSSVHLPLLYRRPFSADEPPPSSVFNVAETAEFQRGDLAAAAEAYRRLARSPDPPVRAAALVRLGRVLRKAGDREGALDAYDDLERLGTVTVAGQPAALVARQARGRVFEEAGDADRLQREAAELGRLLNTGEFPIDRATFELYRDMLQRWRGPMPSPAAVAHAEAAMRLWQSWRAGDLPRRGRRVLRDDEQAVLALWSGGPDRPVAWLATAGELEAALRPLWTPYGLAVSGYDGDGQLLFGEARAGGVSLMPGDTRLPFILSVASLGVRTDGGGDRMRRAVLVSSLLVAFTLMLAASYGVYRATTRELVLARQQADFVSAVSHEFRTPLTSMRHLTDLLASRGVVNEARRAQYYELLAHETERLHRMVESLLSFGRIEAGAYAWQLEPVDAAGLLNCVVEEFRHEPQATGRAVVCEVEEGLPFIRADREALSRAVWNLLENAAKYSEPDTPIRVFARRDDDSMHIGVGDRGFGIPPGEQDGIFQKFVRGADARHAGIRGVGIGLALVKRIIEAHGGSVRVESEPGRGSTFTLVLPCRGS
jgi:signal transduction histidine kinase